MNFLRLIKPVVRLTAGYVAIIMAISVMFSVVIYRQTASQFRAGFIPRDQNFIPPDPRYQRLFEQDIADLFLERYNAVTSHLRWQLILINLSILIGASGASYLLAKRTLRPIENALEEQRRFTADASHELRTPLAAMKTEIEVSLPTGDPGEHRRVLQSNLEEIEKLDRLSTGLLTLARNESSANPLVIESVDFAQVAAEAERRIAAKAQAKKITISPDHLNGHVKGDYINLVDLLAIILDNAVKYSPAKAEIKIHGKWTKNNLCLEIIDHGIGIAAADLPHVFRRFYRTDTARTKAGNNGFGLGLAIAQQIVEHHHGTINITSTVGRGTTVTITLPRS